MKLMYLPGAVLGFLPGGGEKNLAAPPSPQRFFAFLHTILLILFFMRKFGSPQRSRFRGVETPLNGQGVASP